MAAFLNQCYILKDLCFEQGANSIIIVSKLIQCIISSEKIRTAEAERLKETCNKAVFTDVQHAVGEAKTLTEH